MASLKTAEREDRRARLERRIQRAGLTEDPWGEMWLELRDWFDELREWQDELKASRSPTLTIDQAGLRKLSKACLSSEERRRWMIGCALVLVVCVVLAATAGWSFRDSMLMRHCMTLYQSDVCLAITR